MAEVTAAVAAAHFGPDHDVAAIAVQRDGLGDGRLRKAWPAVHASPHAGPAVEKPAIPDVLEPCREPQGHIPIPHRPPVRARTEPDLGWNA
jgi:hypothetical protein